MGATWEGTASACAPRCPHTLRPAPRPAFTSTGGRRDSGVREPINFFFFFFLNI